MLCVLYTIFKHNYDVETTEFILLIGIASVIVLFIDECSDGNEFLFEQVNVNFLSIENLPSRVPKKADMAIDFCVRLELGSEDLEIIFGFLIEHTLSIEWGTIIAGTIF